MNQHLNQPQQPQRTGHHFSLPVNTLFNLLLTEKFSDEMIHQIKVELFGAEVDETKSLLEEMHLSLLIIVLQCMGWSQEEMWQPALDVWLDTRFDTKDSERSQGRIRCFLTWVYREFHAYYQSNPDETVVIRKRESALVYVLKQDFKWRTSTTRLQANGLPPHLLAKLHSINLLPIVFAELNTQYLNSDLDEVNRRIGTGSDEECLRCLEWIQTLDS